MRWALAQRPDFARKELEYIPVEQFKQFDEGRRDLLERRISEVVAATGSASAGVCTTIRGYAWLVAFAEYYATRAATTGSDKDVDRAARLFKAASHQLGVAWELGRVEGKARPKGPTGIEAIDARARQILENGELDRFADNGS